MWSERVPGRTLALVAVAVAAITMGCGVNRDDQDGRTPGNGSGTVTYDLTEPPTRDEVGMAAGEKVKVVFDESAGPRTVTLTLPEDHRLTADVNLVTFDSHAAGLEAETAAPTGMDMHTPRMELAAATQVLRESLRQLSGSGELAESWRRAAESTAGTEIVRSENVPHKLGYLTVRVQGRFNPVDDKASIAYILFWG